MRGKILAGCLATLYCLAAFLHPFAAAAAPAAEGDAARALRAIGPSTVTVRGEGVASGILIDAAGTVLVSAAHCVSPFPITVEVDAGGPGGAGRVTFEDVRILGIHPDLDLALLKIDPAEHRVALTPAKIADGKPVAGQRVFVVRAPERVAVPASIAAVDRDLDGVAHHEFAAVAAGALSPFDSGAPLIDGAGRVVGVVTFRAENDSDDTGFAIPTERLADAFVPPDRRKRDKRTFETLFQLALRYGRLRDERKANGGFRRYTRLSIECFRRIQLHAPGHTVTGCNLGMAYAQIDEPELGIPWFLRAMRLAPWDAFRENNGREYVQLVLAFRKMNRKDAAFATRDEGLAKYPANIGLWLDLARHGEADGDPAAALRAARFLQQLYVDAHKVKDLDAIADSARRKIGPAEAGRIDAETDGVTLTRVLREREAVAARAKAAGEVWMTETFAAVQREFSEAWTRTPVVRGDSVVAVPKPAPGAPSTPTPKAPTPRSAVAKLVTLATPRPLDVMRNGDVRLRGTLRAFDGEEVHVTVDGKEQRVPWLDLSPASAYRLRSTLIDQKNPDHWLVLGEFGWGLNLKAQAEVALRTAVRLKPDAAARADAIRTTTPGGLLGPASPTAGTPPPVATAPAPTTPVSPGGLAGGVSAPELLKPKEQVRPTKYQQATPEEHAAAIEAARLRAAEVDAKLGIRLVELQTDHFLIFTDWDPAEHGFLKRNLELAYAAVSRHFDIPVKENIFVGKLPVYMFTTRDTFEAFAEQVDGRRETRALAGYYLERSDGTGHMAMWKPDVRRWRGVRAAEAQWAYVLTHEFTHAFVARYRSNVYIPIWLDEGIAEVIASAQFPALDRRRDALLVAEGTPSIQGLLTTRMGPPAPMYPVMQTLVETLAAGAKEKTTFLSFFNDIKDGTAVEESLKKHYKTDFPGLERAWRAHIDRTRNIGPR